jgi:hypothetical protein
MSLPDISTVIVSIVNLFSQSGGAANLPVIQETVGAQNYTFIRTALGAFAGSGAVGALYLYFREKLYLLPLRFRRNHTIVCGLNYHSLLILRDLARRHQKPVIIEKNSQNTYLDSCRLEGITVIIGDPADKNILTSAGVKRARYILAFSENDDANAEIALMTMKVVPSSARHKITPVIQILDPRLYMMVRKQAIPLESGPGFSIEFFNRYAMGAKLVLDRYPPLCSDEPGSLSCPVIVFGAGTLGETMITRIARTWYNTKTFTGQKPQIFLVDLNAEKISEDLRNRYVHLRDACDLVPVALDVRSSITGKWAFLEDPGLEKGFTAYICFGDDSMGLYTASFLSHQGHGQRTRIIVRIEHSPNLARLISDEQRVQGGVRDILPVDMNSLTADSALIQAGEQELLARAIHEFYCFNQQQRGDTVLTNRLLVSWEELGALTLKKDGIDGRKFQESNRNQARMIRHKLNAIGCDIGPITDWDAPENFRFSPEEIEYLSELEHERWMQEKLSEGWRYGSRRDDRKKTHPSLIPYNDLSEPEKEKDRDTIKLIPRIISLIDFQVYRFSRSGSTAVPSSGAPPQTTLATRRD